MSSATCAEAIKSGENSMKKSYRSIEHNGIEDYLRELCVIYRGEMDNPHDVNATTDEERAIQFLKFHLWDVEKSLLETPGSWRFMYIEEKGSLPVDDETIARKLYDFVVRKKLERVKEFGIDLIPLYNSVKPQ
jgi:hypothetical protein